LYKLHTFFEGNGKNLPWYQITHTIPNRDFNEATIINTDAEIKVIKEKLAFQKVKLLDIKNEIKDICGNISALNVKIDVT